MQITHKTDGSEFDPEVDLAQQLLEDEGDEITRPGAFEEGLVVVRTVPFEFPATKILEVTEGNFDEISKPTGAPCRWFRWPYRNRLLLDAGHPDELLTDFNEEFAAALEPGMVPLEIAAMDAENNDPPPAEGVVGIEEAQEDRGILGMVPEDEMPPVDGERTEP